MSVSVCEKERGGVKEGFTQMPGEEVREDLLTVSILPLQQPRQLGSFLKEREFSNAGSEERKRECEGQRLRNSIKTYKRINVTKFQM